MNFFQRRNTTQRRRPVTTGHSRLTPGYSQPLYDEPAPSIHAPTHDYSSYDRGCNSSYDSGSSSDSGSCSYD